MHSCGFFPRQLFAENPASFFCCILTRGSSQGTDLLTPSSPPLPSVEMAVQTSSGIRQEDAAQHYVAPLI